MIHTESSGATCTEKVLKGLADCRGTGDPLDWRAWQEFHNENRVHISHDRVILDGPSPSITIQMDRAESEQVQILRIQLYFGFDLSIFFG